MPFRAVLFDLGGVVLDSPFEGIARYEAAAGLPAGIVAGLNRTNPDTNAWARYERGELNLDGFRAAFEAEARDAGHTLDARGVLDALQGEVRPMMVRAIARLRSAGFRCGAGTNNMRPLESSPHGDEIIALFDVVVQSSIEGVRKPEGTFYERALDRLGVDAKECVFLDDLGVNLKTARAMGLTTIKVTDPQAALDELSAVIGVDLG